MNKTILKILIPHPFDLKSTLIAHGWASLQPNLYDKESGTFSRVERLLSGKVIRVNFFWKEKHTANNLQTIIESDGRLTEKEIDNIHELLRHMLRLDENFSPFYEKCKQYGAPWETLSRGGGRLLRSPTLFEDLVKVILTTNIQWSGTRRMVKELVDAYGEVFPGCREMKTFPLPRRIAKDSLEEFKEKVNLGYRADYIHMLAKKFSSGEISEDDYLDVNESTDEVRKRLLAIKGIGAYAAATMLMILGRYDDIPVDTIFREFTSEKYFKGRDFNLKEALSIYDKWEKWKYLAYWFDDH